MRLILFALSTCTPTLAVFLAVMLTAAVPLAAQTPDAEFDFGRQQVHSLTFSPDGRLLAAGGFSGEVRVWNVAGRREVKRFAAHDDQVRVAVFTPDGKTLVTADPGGTVKLWDTSQWAERSTFEVDILYDATLTPDGKLLIVGQFGASRSFDVSTGKLVRKFPQQTGVNGVAVTPDGKTLIASSESMVIGWDLSSGRRLFTMTPGIGGYMRCMAMSRNGSLVAAGMEQKYVVVWDLKTRKRLHALEMGAAEIADTVAFSPDNRTLAAESEGTTRLFDAVMGKLIRKWDASACDRLTISPDSALLATGGMTVDMEGKVQLWTIGKPVKVPNRP